MVTYVRRNCIDCTEHWRGSGKNNTRIVDEGYARDMRLPPRSAENSTFLGYYAASIGNFLPTFREKVLVPSSGFLNPEPSGWNG